MCQGRLGSRRRIFNAPDDLRRSRAGLEYPLDWWPENGRAHRPGLLRYDNALPPRLVRRIIHCFSTQGSLVMDPFLGSAETARWCWRLERRFIGGDVNPHALRFSGARMLGEEIWPSELAPELSPVASAA
jgi:DNA modification methylase